MPDPHSQVGRYTILRQLARGGMAVVYLARQPDLEREVALKELSAFHALDPAMAERFSREARVAAALAHPSIVTVFEFFEHDGLPYIAMEYLERGSLRPLVGRLTLPQVAGVLEGVLAALAHAEAHGVVHRDMKPENVLITPEGRVKIADFGIAKAYNRVWTANFPTATGMSAGTPTYMAPEQAMGESIGPWSDLYATGVLAYELLTGRPPFLNPEEPLAVLMKHLHEPVPPLLSLRPEMDERLAAWVERMLDKSPAQRPAGAAEAWSLLEDVVLDLAGPLWRRDARLPVSGEASSRPLTPAPFDEPPRVAPVPPAAPASRATPPPPPAPAVQPPEITPAPVTAVLPADAPPPPRRSRRRRTPLLAAAAGTVVVAAGVVFLLGRGGEDGERAAGIQESTTELATCFEPLLGDTPRADVVVGVDRELGSAASGHGRRTALVLRAPDVIGVMTFTYRAAKPQDYFEFGELRDASCKKLDPVLQGAGTLPNIQSYDRVRGRFGGIPYQVGIAQEGGVLKAQLERLPRPELAITTARLEDGRAVVEGTIAPDADANVDLTIEVSGTPATGPPIRASRKVKHSAARFRTRFRVPADLTGATAASVRVDYPGDDTYAPQSASATLGT